MQGQKHKAATHPVKLFLQIRVGDWKQFGYQQPWLRFASAQADDVVGAEMDSASEAVVVDWVLPLCRQAQSIFVLVEALPDANLGSALPVLHELFSVSDKVAAVVMRGQNTLAAKMLAAWQKKRSLDDDDDVLREKIRTFAAGQLNPERESRSS